MSLMKEGFLEEVTREPSCKWREEGWTCQEEDVTQASMRNGMRTMLNGGKSFNVGHIPKEQRGDRPGHSEVTRRQWRGASQKEEIHLP